MWIFNLEGRRNEGRRELRDTEGSCQWTEQLGLGEQVMRKVVQVPFHYEDPLPPRTLFRVLQSSSQVSEFLGLLQLLH